MYKQDCAAVWTERSERGVKSLMNLVQFYCFLRIIYKVLFRKHIGKKGEKNFYKSLRATSKFLAPNIFVLRIHKY